MLLSLILGSAWAVDPVPAPVPAAVPSTPSPDERARSLKRTGVVEIGAGLAGLTGGVMVLSVGRGPSGELSDESRLESDIRGLSGGMLLVGGLTTVLVGMHQLDEAKAWREKAAPKVSLMVGPGAVGVGGRF